MKTKQLALNALKKCLDEFGPEHDGKDFESECTECWTAKQAREAVAALEADIAQPVEPFAWAWEVLPDSPIQKRQGAKSGVSLDNPSELGIDIDGKESTSNYKWTLLYTTPPEPAVNAWIAVSERLPIMGKAVWFYTDDLRNPIDQWIGIYNGEWFSCGTSVSNVTHWMPLPAAPKATS